MFGEQKLPKTNMNSPKTLVFEEFLMFGKHELSKNFSFQGVIVSMCGEHKLRENYSFRRVLHDWRTETSKN